MFEENAELALLIIICAITFFNLILSIMNHRDKK